MSIREAFRERAARKRQLVPVEAALDFLGDAELFSAPPSSKDKIDFENSQIRVHYRPDQLHGERQLHLANLDARLLVRALVDKDGTLIFSAADADWLGDIEDAIIDPVVAQVRKVWQLDAAKDKDEGDPEKNSGIPTSSSPTGSR